MSKAQAPQYIQVGNQRVRLPDGVTVAEWALEKVRWQNPRIRAFLGCTRLLGEVLESNYAILHCSPERLLEIWRKVRKVVGVMRDELAPLLSEPSVIPGLEDARQSALGGLELLAQDVFTQLDRFPAELPKDRRLEARKLLCVSIGQLHAFLQDTFGEIMAADPRSLHDADYFLSRRFPQDIDEAEWLHATVQKLLEYLEPLDRRRREHLALLASELQREKTLPTGTNWSGVHELLEELFNELTAKLKGVLALRGIRFHEMEILDRYAVEIPNLCRQVITLQDAGQEIVSHLERSPASPEQMRQDLTVTQDVICRRMTRQLIEIDDCLRDLSAFVPLWIESIEKRRALMLKRSVDETDRDGYPPGPETDAEFDRLLI